MRVSTRLLAHRLSGTEWLVCSLCRRLNMLEKFRKVAVCKMIKQLAPLTSHYRLFKNRHPLLSQSMVTQIGHYIFILLVVLYMIWCAPNIVYKKELWVSRWVNQENNIRTPSDRSFDIYSVLQVWACISVLVQGYVC